MDIFMNEWMSWLNKIMKRMRWTHVSHHKPYIGCHICSTPWEENSTRDRVPEWTVGRDQGSAWASVRQSCYSRRGVQSHPQSQTCSGTTYRWHIGHRTQFRCFCGQSQTVPGCTSQRGYVQGYMLSDKRHTSGWQEVRLWAQGQQDQNRMWCCTLTSLHCQHLFHFRWILTSGLWSIWTPTYLAAGLWPLDLWQCLTWKICSFYDLEIPLWWFSNK